MPSPYTPKRDGLYHDPRTGRTMEHRHYATRIYWSAAMTDYLRRHFPTTLNDELAGCLGVSPRTMIRKARELGLQKDPAWLKAVWDERRRMAHAASRHQGGNSGQFRKGEHANPDGEFRPGHRLTDEQRQRQAEAIRRYNRRHPQELKARGAKIWATRRKNIEQTINTQSVPPSTRTTCY